MLLRKILFLLRVQRDHDQDETFHNPRLRNSATRAHTVSSAPMSLLRDAFVFGELAGRLSGLMAL